MTQYLLPRHVHVCRRGEDFVFLDLRQDDYTLVNGAAAAALRASIFMEHDVANETVASDPLRALLEGGLLTTDESIGKQLNVTQVEPAVDQLLDFDTIADAHITAIAFLRFFSACSVAALRLRWGRLENTIQSIVRRKSRHSAQPLDVARARELTAVFYKLRALFPFNYLCLFDSLALIEFLARYRIFPTWVFGVKLEPWAAHCWIQHGPLAFNENPETAAGYTPIMVI